MGISSAGWGFPFFMVAAAAFMFQPGERLNRGIYQAYFTFIHLSLFSEISYLYKKT